MSRHGYIDYDDGYDDDATLQAGRWRAIIASATRGGRGQRFFRELLAALDAMPEKRLVEGDLEDDEGAHCALGVLGAARGLPVSEIDTYDHEALGEQFDIAEQLAQEVKYQNDEAETYAHPGVNWKTRKATPEERWSIVREWVARQIRVTPDELLPLEAHAQG
jgi:hypothetical protein